MLRHPLCPLVLIASLLLPSLPALAADGTSPEALLPADTQVLTLIRDMPALRAKWANHPLAKTMKDEQVRAFLAPMLEEMDWDELEAELKAETGLTLSEAMDMFDGDVAIAITDVSEFDVMTDEQELEFDDDGNLIEPEELDVVQPDQPAPMIMLVELGDSRDKFEKMVIDAQAKRVAELADAGYKLTDRVEKVGKHTLHLLSVTKDGETTDTSGWAITAKWAVMGGTHDLLRQTIQRIDAGGQGESLAASPNYKEFLADRGDSDALVYLNVQAIVAKIMADYKAEQEAEAAAADPDDPPAEPNPFEVTAEKVVAALGVDVMRGAGFTLAITDNHTDLDVVVHYTERKGLTKLLAFTEGPVPMPKVIPASAIMAGSTNYSVDQMWAEMWNMLTAMSPMIGMMAGQGVAAMNQEMGIDLHRDLIKPMGGHMLTATFFRTPEPGQQPTIEKTDSLYMFELDDADTFRKTIDKLVLKAEENAALEGQFDDEGNIKEDPDVEPEPMFTKRKYLGVTIHEMVTEPLFPEDEPEVVAYAITDKYVMLAQGSAAPIETVLVNQKQGIQSVWEKPAVAAALKDMPANASAVGYTDLKAVAGSMVALARQMAALGAIDGEAPFDPDVKINPDKLGRYLGPAIGAVYADDKHMSYKFRMVHDNAAN